MVPQHRWTPPDEADVQRLVARAALELPMFFVNRNGVIGFPLVHILSLRGCDGDLHNANGFASLAGKSTIRIHIGVSLSLSY